MLTPVTQVDILILRPSPGKWLTALLVSLGGACVGAWMIGRYAGAMPWLIIALCGLGVVISFIQLIPGASYLLLTPSGFVVCSLYRLWPLMRWNSVSEFRVVEMGRARREIVAFDWDQDRHSALANLNEALADATNALPDTYGRSASGLAVLMNQWRARALTMPASAPQQI